jgi:hypothetical protein
VFSWVAVEKRPIRKKDQAKKEQTLRDGSSVILSEAEEL